MGILSMMMTIIYHITELCNIHANLKDNVNHMLNLYNQECLLYCEDYVCDDKYFKCPSYYCVPWRFVCSGQWECPGGTDESSCEQVSCPGMFKCKDSSICIPSDNLCDLYPDCWKGDDEYFCPEAHQFLPSCPSKWAGILVKHVYKRTRHPYKGSP